MSAFILNSTGQCNASRTIDRVCEDAQHTGHLILSSRKLKEYPNVTTKYALHDITGIDLSRNRYAEVPVEVCDLMSLEYLNCFHNVIRNIPDGVIHLQTLVHLNLNRNQLTTIPPAVCQLGTLEILLVNNNKLVSLPEEIGQLEHLTEMDVSCNVITHIPSQIGELKSLLNLNLRRNLLVKLPDDICKLRLRKIDISENRIAQIPLHLCYSENLEEIVVKNNPLVSPPSAICAKGKVHILKYLHGESLRDGRQRSTLDEAEFQQQSPRLSSLHMMSKSDTLRTKPLTTDHPNQNASDMLSNSAKLGQSAVIHAVLPKSEEFRQRHEDLIATQRREAQLIKLSMEEERQKMKHFQKDVVYNFIKRTQGLQIIESQNSEQQGMIGKPMNSSSWQSAEKNISHSVSSHDSALTPRCQKVLESMSGVLSNVDPALTIRRNLHYASEEMHLIQHMRKIIEMHLKMVLPENITAALKDGVVLCHLANHMRPGSVPSIHVPSPAVPKLTTAKCRRNVEYFLSACQSIGVPQNKLCSPTAVLEESRILEVANTVISLSESINSYKLI